MATQKEIDALKATNKELKQENKLLGESNQDLVKQLKKAEKENAKSSDNDLLVVRLKESTEVLKKIQHQFYFRSDRYVDPIILANDGLLETLK